MYLKVDGLECNKEEIKYVLKYFKHHKKEFEPYKDDNVKLHDYLCELIRAYRYNYGYHEDINKRLRFEVRK